MEGDKTLSLRKSYPGEGWNIVDHFDIKSIEEIDDGTGGDTNSPIASIPSPFGRIDLLRTAFRNLNSGKNYPDSERLVSRMLDLGELLFNIDSEKDKIVIDKWDITVEGKKVATTKLRTLAMKGHVRLANVLDIFLKQDAGSYNFGPLTHLHVISYEGYVIGGTSPVTMLFTTPNDHYFQKINIRFGGHRLFDPTGRYVPLHERDVEYQKMWYYLVQSNPNFKTYFKELDEYIEASMRRIRESTGEVRDAIFSERGALKVDAEYVSTRFAKVTAGGRNNEVDILGIPFLKKKIEHVQDAISRRSQFAVSSRKYQGKIMPMVLQNGFSKPLQYTESTLWVPGTDVPPYVQESWKDNARTLPGLKLKYPWLTVNDLLEPYLVKLSFPVNKDQYYLGKEEGIRSDEAYLPALKQDFFLLFDADDLVAERVKYHCKALEAGEIQITLEIPINNSLDYIVLTKDYMPIPKGANNFGLPVPDLHLNQGFIIDVPFNTIVYPPIRFNSAHVTPDYRIQLTAEKMGLIEDMSLRFLGTNIDEPITPVKTVDNKDFKYRSAPESVFQVTTKYYRVEREFDMISLQMENKSANAVINATIIPKWVRYENGNDSYVVAVDFGTTNTHIEFARQGNDGVLLEPRPFNVGKSQLLSLGTLSRKIDPIDLFLSYLYEFLPEKSGRDFAFPIRTVISEASGVNHSAQDLALFSDFNIPFYFEKESKRRPDKLFTNLKWARVGTVSNNHTTFFLEELALMIRNKILMEGGDLRRTRLIWTYPSSMKGGHRRNLAEIWRRIFEQYIGGERNNADTQAIVSVKESVAPFYHYRRVQRNLLAGQRPVVSVDIGGGTTDTVVYFREKPQILTSFRFAGNAIFGDGFKDRAAQSNGFVQRYKKIFEDLLATNKIGELKNYNEDVVESGNSENIISFWFSIEKHPDVQNPSLMSFNTRLSNDSDMKVVFLLFYVAVTYHIAAMMKHKGYEMPNGFIFSGTGSKMLQIITTDSSLLEKLTKEIIERVYERPYEAMRRLSVFCDGVTPKEATCKGVLSMTAEDLAEEPENVIFTGLNARPFANLTYEDVQHGPCVTEILDEIKAFYDFFFKLSAGFDFEDEFDVSSKALKIAREELYYNLDDYLYEAIQEKGKGLSDLDKDLEDTLFFYPIIGSMNALAFKLSQNSAS